MTAPANLPSHAPAPADGALQRQDPRIVGCERLAGWVATAILAAIAGALLGIWAWLGEPAPKAMALVGSGVGALLLLGTWHWQRWPAVSYRHTWYRVTDQAIEIRRGAVWKSVVTIPRGRIQHTDVSQGPLERRWGLGTLVIHTAGDQFSAITLDGLSHGEALRIRDRLVGGRPDDGA
ncbi:MAG: PH domain-containing protein [Gemmatimonadales bacterium]|nr:PH domain-containing protein [Gemmatimonadales bacterium]